MRYRNILKIFLIVIFVIGTLSVAYANGGPEIGENEIKNAAQDYLDSNNLAYTAVTPEWDDLMYEVKDTQTGEIKWVPENLIADDGTSFSGRYNMTDGYPTWIVQVNDKTGKNVGQIYVDAGTAQVLKVVINGKVLKDVVNQREQLTNNYYESTTDENMTEDYGYPSEYTDILATFPISEISYILSLNSPLSLIILIIAIYWMYGGIE